MCMLPSLDKEGKAGCHQTDGRGGLKLHSGGFDAIPLDERFMSDASLRMRKLIIKLCIIIWTQRGGQEPAFQNCALKGHQENSLG